MKADSCLILPVISHYIPNAVDNMRLLEQPSGGCAADEQLSR